jgi:hypothetical protein
MSIESVSLASNTMLRRAYLPVKKYFPSSICLPLMVSFLVACARPEVGIRSLSANTITPQAQISAAVNGNDIEVTVILVNRGITPFALLKWNLPEDGRLDGSLFDVTRDGTRIEYRGIEIKRSVSGTDYISLETGREYSSNILLAQGYDVQSKGKYKIQYRAWNPVPDGSKVLHFESNITELQKR